MKLFKHILLLSLAASLTACQSKKGKKPAHFRALSMIQYTPATLSIQGQGKNKQTRQTFSLGYAQPTNYRKLAPGHYKITLLVKGKPILKGHYVLGKNGYYTLLAMGLLPKKWKANPQTTMYHLKHIFAGEELESTNNYLPQWMMMRDNYDGSKESAYIRLVNANPYTATIKVKNEGKSLKNGLVYPIESSMLKLKAGRHTLQILYGNIMLGEKKIDTKPGYIYTAVISRSKNSQGGLSVSILENPSRTLLKSKQ